MKDFGLNVYECRLCTFSIWAPCPEPGQPVALGWKRIKGIDGPDSVCPICANSTHDVLMWLREDGYTKAEII